MCDVPRKKSDDSYIQFITHVGGIDLITDELTRIEYGDLACLENVAHRSGEGLFSLFRVMVIDIPDGVLIDTTQPETLPPDWTDYQQYGFCQ